ncbi:MAG TPA: ATP-binding protein [Nocardioidaceae bacterium]|nr:ATP-binding protein [Nocardioidaceae bacterium]
MSLVLPLDPGTAAEARHFVRRHAHVHGLDHQTEETAELLTSELVTNAVIHGRSSVSVTVSATPTQCLVEVGDDNPRLPLVLEPDEQSLNGRGLAIVCGLADACGTYPHADGKVVWFQLHLTAVPC